MNRKIINFFFLLVVLFLACECVVGKEAYTNIESPEEKIVIEGVSLLSPQGNGWHVAKKDLAHLEVAKMGTSKDQSILGAVILFKLPEIKSEEEFLALVSKQRGRIPQDEPLHRFENIFNKESISNERNTFCVRFHTKYKDYGAKNLPESSEYLIVEDIGIICQHPDNKNIGVTIVMSQRTRENNEFKDFIAIADGFIANAKFIPFTMSNSEIGFNAFKERHYKKAIEYFNKAIAEDPEDYVAYFYRGFCYFDQKKYSLALLDWGKTIFLKKDFIEAYANISSIYLEKKDYEKALYYVNMAIKYGSSLSPEEQLRREIPVAYTMRVEINIELKNYEQVIQDSRYLVKLGSNNWSIYNNLVYILIIDHNPNIDKEECFALLKKAEELTPNKYLYCVYDTYGQLFLKLGENKKALEYFNKAFEQANDPKEKKEIKERIDNIRNNGGSAPR